MDTEKLLDLLSGLPIPSVRAFDVIGSTNDEVLQWAASGGSDGCLAIADQQTQGRGRLGRHWVTRPGAALAFSLLLLPTPPEQERLHLFSPLGALAICQALEDTLNLAPQIKWPNDVLLNRRKAAGILVEASWMGGDLQGIVVGIGLNVAQAAVPPANEVIFPATSVEEAAGQPVDRWKLLRAILHSLFEWRSRLGTPAFQQAWEQRLAFRGEWVRVQEAVQGQAAVHGQVVGLDPQGNLLLKVENGTIIPVQVGDVHLRLVE